MELSNNVTERVDEVFEGTFTCASCGFETTALVTAWAKAAADKRIENAREEARALAEEEAGNLASRTLMFVPCPACGKRDPKATAYRVQVVLGALALGAAMFAVLFVTFMKVRWDRALGAWTPVIAAAGGGVIAIRTFLKYRRAWTRLDERVQLGSTPRGAVQSTRNPSR